MTPAADFLSGFVLDWIGSDSLRDVAFWVTANRAQEVTPPNFQENRVSVASGTLYDVLRDGRGVTGGGDQWFYDRKWNCGERLTLPFNPGAADSIGLTLQLRERNVQRQIRGPGDSPSSSLMSILISWRKSN
jgi:hypothetical protein